MELLGVEFGHSETGHSTRRLAKSGGWVSGPRRSNSTHHSFWSMFWATWELFPRITQTTAKLLFDCSAVITNVGRYLVGKDALPIIHFRIPETPPYYKTNWNLRLLGMLYYSLSAGPYATDIITFLRGCLVKSVMRTVHFFLFTSSKDEWMGAFTFPLFCPSTTSVVLTMG